jgi:hypothetical protein
MTKPGRIPKVGDHVGFEAKKGTFVVMAVYVDGQVVDIQMVGEKLERVRGVAAPRSDRSDVAEWGRSGLMLRARLAAIHTGTPWMIFDGIGLWSLRR